MTSASRRQFNQLALAAFSGALTGSVLGCSGGKQQKALDSKSADGMDKSAASETAKTYDENLLLVGDPHVCRGLNQCKNQGKTHMNECAGQGLRHGRKARLRRPQYLQGARRLRRASGPESVQGTSRLRGDTQGRHVEESPRKFRRTHGRQEQKSRTGSGKRLIAMSSPTSDLANIQAWMQSVIMNRAGVVDGVASADGGRTSTSLRRKLKA